MILGHVTVLSYRISTVNELYHEVAVAFNYRSSVLHYYIQVRNVEDKKEDYYIEQAKTQVEQLISKGTMAKYAEKLMRGNSLRVTVPLVCILSIFGAVLATGIAINATLFSESFYRHHDDPVDPDPDPGIGPLTPVGTHSKWYEYTEEERWWEHCSISASEKADESDIGQIVSITLNGLKHDIRLIAVDHIEPGGSAATAHCTFEFVNLITSTENVPYSIKWDANATDNTKFSNSTLNKALDENGDIYNMFTGEARYLLSYMSAVKKYIGVAAPDDVSTTNDDTLAVGYYVTKLFPLSEEEVFGGSAASCITGEGSQYSYYSSGTPVYKKAPVTAAAQTPTNYYYWLRSPCNGTGNETKAVCIDNNGASSTAVIGSNSYGIAPAFCI